MTSHGSRIALAGVALALAFSSSVAMASTTPIPGIDVIVLKNNLIVQRAVVSDASGRFSIKLAEPGQYTATTACHEGRECPRYTVSINASGQVLRPGRDGSYAFTVGPREPVLLSGTIQGADSASAATKDVHPQPIPSTRK